VTAPTADTHDTGLPALEVRGIESGYGRTTILRDVSLTVASSTVSALLGPNGAGKTTLLRTISGFVRPRKGSILLFGEDITNMSPHKRFQRGLCLVPEGRGVFRSLTVRENLVMQSVRGQESEAVDRAAAAFPLLKERLRSQAGTLSGGQQQMLAMAAAYVREPRLLLVDEASFGLAPIIVDEIFASLQRVAASGAALLMVDQFAERALQMAASACVMRRGSIIYDGAAESLRMEDLFAEYVQAGEVPPARSESRSDAAGSSARSRLD